MIPSVGRAFSYGSRATHATHPGGVACLGREAERAKEAGKQEGRQASM